MVDRNNTIAGWALAAGIVALGSSILFGKVIHGEVPGEGKQGYAIQGVESGGGGEAAVPLATLLASADIAKGEAIFKKCTACHTINQGGANGVGPNLFATMGKAHGHVAGEKYTEDKRIAEQEDPHHQLAPGHVECLLVGGPISHQSFDLMKFA